MFRLFRRTRTPSEVERLVSILVDKPARSPQEVFHRCEAADALGELGPTAIDAMPALLRTLVVPVSVDCGLALRVAAAIAIWRVSHRSDVAIPYLTWALKDEQWGVVPRAVAVLSEIGHAAVVPDLVRLAEHRLAHGPLLFERLSRDPEDRESSSLLVVIAGAIGQCALGRWNERSYTSEARSTLTRLADSEDDRLRAAALEALARLDEQHFEEQVH